MIVTFCGHGDFVCNDEVFNTLKNTIEELIRQGAREFLCGGYGNFDSIAAHILFDFKEQYPDIKSLLVVPYLNRDYNLNLYDDSVYPPIENVPKRFAILKRNEWMVQKSDVIIAYLNYEWGGAYKTLIHAKRKKKKIINLGKLDCS